MARTGGRPGRRRDPDVMARDERIYALIASGTGSRSELATATGVDRDAVHLSCKRLERQGRIRKYLGRSGSAAWETGGDAPDAS